MSHRNRRQLRRRRTRKRKTNTECENERNIRRAKPIEQQSPTQQAGAIETNSTDFSLSKKEEYQVWE
jgi:hypothetical protein